MFTNRTRLRRPSRGASPRPSWRAENTSSETIPDRARALPSLRGRKLVRRRVGEQFASTLDLSSLAVGEHRIGLRFRDGRAIGARLPGRTWSFTNRTPPRRRFREASPRPIWRAGILHRERSRTGGGTALLPQDGLFDDESESSLPLTLTQFLGGGRAQNRRAVQGRGGQWSPVGGPISSWSRPDRTPTPTETVLLWLRKRMRRAIRTILHLHPLNTGLVAYYPFDGNASDMSGNGNHGTVNGNPVLGSWTDMGLQESLFFLMVRMIDYDKHWSVRTRR